MTYSIGISFSYQAPKLHFSDPGDNLDFDLKTYGQMHWLRSIKVPIIFFSHPKYVTWWITYIILFLS
ncbi:MAG: hypothetical protein MJA30_37320 [Cytophagales bacterium]|nr:hypothetical protein [Cytophagales bacterium]